MTPSVTSVSTPDVRLGQAIHSPPAGKTIVARRSMRRSSSALRVKNATTTSARPRAWCFITTPDGSPVTMSGGAFTRARVVPSSMPSFPASGVPLYPTTVS